MYSWHDITNTLEVLVRRFEESEWKKFVDVNFCSITWGITISLFVI